MKRIWITDFAALLLFFAWPGAQAENSNETFNYTQTDRSAERRVHEEGRTDGILERFEAAYRAAKRPRIMLLINEDYSEAVADDLEVAGKSDASLRVEGNLPVSQVDKTPMVQVNVGNGTAKTADTQIQNLSAVEDVDGEVLGTVRQYSRRQSDFTRYKITPQNRSEMEDLFCDPWVKVGARFVDKNLVLDSSLIDLVPELLTQKQGVEKTARIKSIAEKTDLIIELLVTGGYKVSVAVYGDEIVEIPRLTARVIDLKTGTVLARASTRRLLNSDAIAGRLGLLEEGERERWVIEQVSMNTMEGMITALEDMNTP